MIPSAFAYVRPETVDEALAALAEPEARLMAGGHSLLPMMKLRLAAPSVVVDISRLDLGGVRADGTGTRIGALTTYDELLRADGDVPGALRDAVAAVGDVQVRNAGTIGGALAHADPASDVAAAALALDARLVLRSPSGARETPVDGFFLGPLMPALADQEMIVEVVVPRRRDGEGSAYVAFDDPASGYALAGAAVRVTVADGRIASCAVALTGAASVPLRLPDVETALSAGADPTAAIAALEVVAGGDDAGHRRQLAKVAILRATALARARAGAAV